MSSLRPSTSIVATLAQSASLCDTITQIAQQAKSSRMRHAVSQGWDYPLKNNGSHIDASLSRQPLVKGERLVRAEMNAVIIIIATTTYYLLEAFAMVRPVRTWSLSLLTSCACLRVGARPDGFLLYLFEPTLRMGKWKHIRALRRAYGVDPISSMPEDST